MGGAASAAKDMVNKAKEAADQAKAKIEEVKNKAQDAYDAGLAYLHEWVPDTGDRNPPPGQDLLLAYKALALCKLSYLTTDTHPECADLEAKWIKALNITDYTMWLATTAAADMAKKLFTDADGKNKEELDKAAGGAEAISGMISNVSAELTEPMPFVCYRGTQSPSDMLSDLASLVPSDFVTTNGSKVGRTGMGFWQHYKALRDVVKVDIGSKTIIQQAVEKAKTSKNGLLICGHSLGSAIATLLTAELYTDYPNQFPIHLITFGGPRVFDNETAVKVHQYSLPHYLRFINSGDLITVLGDKAVTQLMHSGIAVLCPPPPKAGETYSEDHDFKLITGDNAFDWTLKPAELAKAIATFALAFAAPHSINGKNSYATRFDNSFLFQNELANLSGSLKESFANIPALYDIPTPKPPKKN
mmetsp:Transcript_6804/g.6111  ORF Transcript_6804/g.6111 Transcript_6804/m.6111 type:complete len:417 (+) Transcript_6804:85-1335(+)|eukprot:CAMPEP_0196764054 /NCGR_PEP_ID=MMETSP1095-20130614/5293_1 /TAXON_ID=96789 ORGANISM="Chromulina nebulosa, Strain UTEXLB2642" /NCGR_SAMPLE_ID=MMETSP1095 /ASSEMBLY_ACC=CAM_ASM_000446 /LENGTH=416 /DNA_ID=CAMNT_0042118629 /DNA_START=68 /DNA_END=1321 /DNA_ORIENTATION=-